MANNITAPLILSPVMLWGDFDASQPLKESNTGEEVFGDVVYRDMYFSGRETPDGRVRIFGVYAKSKQTGKKSSKGAILILPDMDETVNYDVIKLYVSQGYSVLMVDYRGEWEGVENYTKYPASVSYANYKNVMDNTDAVPQTAKETCWYEWASVAKYAVSFLKSRLDIEKIGVLGIKNGANIGWILCGTDARVDCFVPLFGAGWRGYKGVYKNGSEELRADDDNVRFLAGIDAHAYAQYVKCPVFFMTATNSNDFDFDRSVDTMIRISENVINYTNYTPYFKDVLNINCKRNIDLFFAKYLLDFRLVFPKEPILSCMVEGDKVVCDLELDYSDLLKPKFIDVYVAEGGVNPGNREWQLAKMHRGLREDRRSFTYKITGNCDFVTVYGIIEYRNGVTLSTKALCKKATNVSENPQRLLFSSKDKLATFTAYNTKPKALANLYFDKNDQLSIIPGPSGIEGVSSPYGLVTYRMNNHNVAINANSLVLFDFYCPEFTNLKVTLMVEHSATQTVDYSVLLDLKGGNIWQNISIKANDFKNTSRLSIKDYTKVVGLRFETDAVSIFNNILII